MSKQVIKSTVLVLHHLKVPDSPNVSKYSNKMFFVIFLVVVLAQIVDTGIGSLADILKDFTVSFWGVVLFIGISVVSGFGQYTTLGMVKSKNKEKEIRKTHFNILEKIVTTVQYVLLAILGFIVLQILLSSEYSTIILKLGVVISYGLASYVMGMLSYSLFRWFRENRALVVLLYGLAAAVIVIYVVAIALILVISLQEKPSVITPLSETIFGTPGIAESLLITLQTFCSIISFFLIWGGNILLLHHNIHRIGKVKFWVLMSTPLIASSIVFLSFYQPLSGGVIGEDLTMSIVIPLLLVMFSQIAALVLIGATFGSVAKALSHTPIIRDYMMITAYGFVLFFIAASTTVSAAGYPPFGFINVLLLGPFAFLVLNGLYRSAVCVAEDTELRHSIKALAKRESRFLDAAASAEAIQEFQNKIMTVTKSSAKLLEEETRIEPSLTDAEIREQLQIVTQELKKY
jgi:hypothetical protein